MKSAGLVIGWNENPHPLSHPWYMIEHPCSTIYPLLQDLSFNHTTLKMVCYVAIVCAQAMLKEKICGPKEDTFDMLEINHALEKGKISL